MHTRKTIAISVKFSIAKSEKLLSARTIECVEDISYNTDADIQADHTTFTLLTIITITK